MAGMRARLSEVWLSRAGCPWKENQGNCTTPDYPSAGTGGVYALSLQFIESVQTVLETYAGPEEAWLVTQNPKP